MIFAQAHLDSEMKAEFPVKEIVAQMDTLELLVLIGIHHMMEELSDMCLALDVFRIPQFCCFGSCLSEVSLIYDLVWCRLCWLF